MPRPPAPCGTISAAKRHRRKKEPLDAACLQAERDEKNTRVARKRQEAGESARAAMPPALDPDGPLDRDEVLHESLRTLRGHLATAPPQSVAAITKAIRETLDALQGPAGMKQEVADDDDDALSDIARAYASRGA